MRRVKEDSDETVRNLIRSALVVFLDLGYPDTRVEDIVTHAGLTRGAFYHHFESKKAIFLALLDHGSMEFVKLSDPESFIKQGGTYLAGLEEYFRHVLQIVASEPRLQELLYLMIYKTSFVKELEDTIGQKRAKINLGVESFARILSLAQKNKEIPPEIDIKGSAYLLYTGLWGICDYWVLDHDQIDLFQRAGFLARGLIKQVLT